MSAVVTQKTAPRRISTTEAPWVRNVLIGLALAFVLLFLVLPLAAVFTEALRKGWALMPRRCASRTRGQRFA